MENLGDTIVLTDSEAREFTVAAHCMSSRIKDLVSRTDLLVTHPFLNSQGEVRIILLEKKKEEWREI